MLECYMRGYYIVMQNRLRSEHQLLEIDKISV